MTMTKQLASANYQLADDYWQAELVRTFGRDACNARYEKRGRGAPGSKLSDLYVAREYARQYWETVTGLKAD